MTKSELEEIVVGDVIIWVCDDKPVLVNSVKYISDKIAYFVELGLSRLDGSYYGTPYIHVNEDNASLWRKVI